MAHESTYRAVQRAPGGIRKCRHRGYRVIVESDGPGDAVAMMRSTTSLGVASETSSATNRPASLCGAKSRYPASNLQAQSGSSDRASSEEIDRQVRREHVVAILTEGIGVSHSFEPGYRPLCSRASRRKVRNAG